MASVPSRMALATSLASALVGRGLRIIESNIWVAVITGLPTALHLAMIIFCTMGTASGGVSTPRSPRATMIASATSMIPSMLSTASGFSILATTGTGESEAVRDGSTELAEVLAGLCFRIISCSSCTSPGLRTKERATQSTCCSNTKRKSRRSLSVMAGMA